MERTVSRQLDGFMGAAQHVMHRIPVPDHSATPLLGKEEILLWSSGRRHSLWADIVSEEFTASRHVTAIPANAEISVSSDLIEDGTPHYGIDHVFVYGSLRLHVQSQGRSHSLRVAIAHPE